MTVVNILVLKKYIHSIDSEFPKNFLMPYSLLFNFNLFFNVMNISFDDTTLFFETILLFKTYNKNHKCYLKIIVNVK